MHLDAVVAVLVGILRVHTLCQGREGICQTAVLLQFCALFGFQLAVATDVLEGFVDIYIAGSLIEKGTASVETGLDVANHLSDCGELDDGFAELLAVASIGNGLVVSSLTETHTLGSNTQTGTVHQRHHIFNKA